MAHIIIFILVLGIVATAGLAASALLLEARGFPQSGADLARRPTPSIRR